MSQPPKSTILAPSARWTAFSAVCLRAGLGDAMNSTIYHTPALSGEPVEGNFALGRWHALGRGGRQAKRDPLLYVHSLACNLQSNSARKARTLRKHRVMGSSVEIVPNQSGKNLPGSGTASACSLSSLSPVTELLQWLGSAVLTQQVAGRWRVELLHGPNRWMSRRGFPLRGATPLRVA